MLLEQLEDDQLDLDLHAQAAAGFDEIVTERMRAEGVALVVELLADQRVHARGQVAQRLGGTTHDLGDHGVDGYGFFQLVVLHQGKAVEGDGIQRGRLADFILVELGECFEQLLQEATLDVAALHAQVAHGLEKSVLFGVTGRAIGDLEERVIGVVEQRLQRLTQLLGGLVAHADERHRKAACR